jgi:hypothetical protein
MYVILVFALATTLQNEKVARNLAVDDIRLSAYSEVARKSNSELY